MRSRCSAVTTSERASLSTSDEVRQSPDSFPHWLVSWMQAEAIELWGASDLRQFSTPVDTNGRGFPLAISWVVPLAPQIMVSVRDGPNQAYADEYARVNARINEMGERLTAKIRSVGQRAQPLAASQRSDLDNVEGDFPGKTATTHAGLGWIGRHCQLVTRRFGSWVRLGTVFTDMGISCRPSVDRNFCSTCTCCVDACPASALSEAAWLPGLSREGLLDVEACDNWKKEHYFKFHQGHNCGICSAVCPFRSKVLRG
jgi:epoxyqueuosine reductase QueG